MSIRKLPTDVAIQLSTGEMIKRPASVVKELIENSIDAGAKNINIKIENSGLQLITVQDDGCGINKNELLLAISRSSTSKIFSLHDLNFLNTFGFRGEALASIRSVSKITLISATQSNTFAWKIYSEGYNNDHLNIQPIAHPVGTSVFIENLFYNLPVRLKFLDSTRQELLRVYDIINQISLAHFYINISLTIDNKIKKQYYAIKNINNKFERIKQVFSKIDLNMLLTINTCFYDIKISGWISSPHNIFISKNIKYCYVNNRYVYNNTILHAIRSAYKEYLGHYNKNLFFILYINIPSSEIDVNIHPTKREIKFRNPYILYKYIYQTVLNILKQFSSTYKENSIISSKKKNSSSNFIKNINNLCIVTNNCSKISKKKINIAFHKKLKISYSFGKLLTIINKYYGLMNNNDSFSLISLPLAKKLFHQYTIEEEIKNNITPKFFFTYIKIDLTYKEYVTLLQYADVLLKLGLSLVFKEKFFILNTAPIFLKKENIKQCILNFIKYVIKNKKNSILEILHWFYSNLSNDYIRWNYTDAVKILLKIERIFPFLVIKPPSELLQNIDINSVLCLLKI